MAAGHRGANGVSATAIFWRSRPLRWSVVGLLVVSAVVAVALLPVSTRQGVDFKVSTIEMSLYVKVLDFLDRDANYGLLARKISAGRTTDEARTLAVFDWVRANIRDVPAGFPVFDDHIWYTIVRGYGVGEQKADVFAALVTYAGVPAYWVKLRPRPGGLAVSLVLIDGRWRVFDVANGFVFRNTAGLLATLEELAANPDLVETLARRIRNRDRRYASYFVKVPNVVPPDILRAEMQMPRPRIVFELKRLMGLRGREWDPDAGARPIQR
jgi:hypothetical protein